MNKYIQKSTLIAGVCLVAFAAIAAEVVGYIDWQVSSAPVVPGTGYVRTWADTSTGLIKCTTAGGAACYFASKTAAALSLETNGTPNGSQVLLNLVAGSNTTITDDSMGDITIASTASSGLTLETGGTPNGSQTLLNLFAGTGISLADNGSGKVTITNTITPLVTHALGMNFTPIGSATTLVAGQVNYVTIPFACSITRWAATVDTGTITYDVWMVTTGTAIPTVANTITAASYPAIASGTAANGVGVGWTTGVSAYNIIGFYVKTVASATTSSIVLTCTGSS